MDQEQFLWEPVEAAEQLLVGWLDELCKANRAMAILSDQLVQMTSTRLFDWIDHFVVTDGDAAKEVGFVEEYETDDWVVLCHPGAQLPSVVVRKKNGLLGIAVKVESISQFLMVRGHAAAIEGSSFARYRRCCFALEDGSALWIVERRGTRTMDPVEEDMAYLSRYFRAKELWEARPRDWEDQEAALRQAGVVAHQMVELIGRDLAAFLVLEVERAYWQFRNRAGQLQKARQDHMGMGWANHDHHTFRSSRTLFMPLVQLFEGLGFTCRERFYAGEEAGWGAQVMESRAASGILFLDVDLAPDEVAIDFTHQQLAPLDKVGTIGLWCGLHGDSIVQAGMHHLEAQFLFDELKSDLGEAGVGMMEPFSDLPHLKQAFTEGELWPVAPHRLRRLVTEKLISEEEADHWSEHGAVGSHMENLQRRAGFKGFNQKNVSYIIKHTNPRSLNP